MAISKNYGDGSVFLLLIFFNFSDPIQITHRHNTFPIAILLYFRLPRLQIQAAAVAYRSGGTLLRNGSPPGIRRPTSPAGNQTDDGKPRMFVKLFAFRNPAHQLRHDFCTGGDSLHPADRHLTLFPLRFLRRQIVAEKRSELHPGRFIHQAVRGTDVITQILLRNTAQSAQFTLRTGGLDRPGNGGADLIRDSDSSSHKTPYLIANSMTTSSNMRFPPPFSRKKRHSILDLELSIDIV